MSEHGTESQNGLPEQQEAICTLFEGDYHYGLAAFVNSLVRAGYTGAVWAGYRGALPPWLDQLERLSAERHEYRVGSQLRLVFVELKTDLHLTNYKPQFMQDLLAGGASDCKYIWYFDPDICIRCTWAVFRTWARYGIALCQENFYDFPEGHPLRCQWTEIAAGMGLSGPRSLNCYFNGGMVGVSASFTDFLSLWNRLIGESTAFGCDLKGFMPGNREMPFHASDQDALNIAAMFTKHPLSTVGPEEMGFVPNGFIMYHTVGPKPWRGSLIQRALLGSPPSNAAKFFLTQVSTPICVYSPWRLRGKRLACATAAFLGRFYSRN
jgi:hypothetical protein